MSFFEIETRSLAGKPVVLSQYRGKVALVVNTASACGYTPQYEGLQRLYEELKGRGLVVIAFPSNEFGGQEPGTADDIQSFCSTTYRVTFPMMEKVQTRGVGQSPAYAELTKIGIEPGWNFHKYLVSRWGQVLRSFKHSVKPDDAELRKAIEAALEGS